MAHQRSITPGGTRGTLFREVARVRLEDAAVLLEQKRYGGAIYLAGYAVECLLKWAVTERQSCIYLPAEFEVHDLDELLVAAGLHDRLQSTGQLWAVYSDLNEAWGPDLRYHAKGPKPKDAERLYQAIEQVYEWLEESATS